MHHQPAILIGKQLPAEAYHNGNHCIHSCHHWTDTICMSWYNMKHMGEVSTTHQGRAHERKVMECKELWQQTQPSHAALKREHEENSGKDAGNTDLRVHFSAHCKCSSCHILKLISSFLAVKIAPFGLCPQLQIVSHLLHTSPAPSMHIQLPAQCQTSCGVL